MPMCEYHQLIAQCQFDNVKNVRQAVKGHGSSFAGNEIMHLSQGPQKHLAQHHMKPSSPHHAHNEEGESP
jgi:hypothetical protein